MSEANTTPDPNAELKELAEELRALGVEVDEGELGKEPLESATQKKVAHAFKQLKDKNKGLVAENEKLKAQPPVVASPPPEVQPQDNDPDMLVGGLVVQAKRNLGKLGTNDRLVSLEVARLYNETVRNQLDAADAPKRTKKVFEDVMSEEGFSVLSAEDKVEVGKRLAGMSPVAQADADVVRREALVYLGQNLSKFAKGEQGEPENRAAAAAAASQARRGGVRPPDSTTSESRPTPPTANEREMMNKLGIKDVSMYRAAVANKNKYVGKT